MRQVEALEIEEHQVELAAAYGVMIEGEDNDDIDDDTSDEEL